MKEKVDLGKLQKNLEAAREAYEAAADRVAGARREESAALRDLTNAQKALDSAMVALRNDAPLESPWRQRRGEAVEA